MLAGHYTKSRVSRGLLEKSSVDLSPVYSNQFRAKFSFNSSHLTTQRLDPTHNEVEKVQKMLNELKDEGFIYLQFQK